MTEPKPLKPYAKYKEEIDFINKYPNQMPSGIACPNDGTELLTSRYSGRIQVSGASEYDLICPKCEWTNQTT